jgi:hypothetical protein
MTPPPKKILGTPLLTSTLLEEEELRRLKRFKATQPDFRKYHFTYVNILLENIHWDARYIVNSVGF